MRLTKRTTTWRTTPACKSWSTSLRTTTRTFTGVRQSHALTVYSKVFYGLSLLELGQIDQSEQVTELFPVPI